ncbi:hypothetical protein CR513_37000, partial [Mucuna pruriens]
MKELREKLDLVGKSLDVVQKDAHSTNNKVEALSRVKEKGVRGHNDHSRKPYSSKEEKRVRHERHRREERDDLDLGKCKIPRFVGDCKLKVYIDWELKVEQLMTNFGVQGRKGVSLVIVALEDYALVWCTSLMDDIRREIEEPCESWYDLKRMMRKRFVPTSYERYRHHKLQSLY